MNKNNRFKHMVKFGQFLKHQKHTLKATFNFQIFILIFTKKNLNINF